MKREGEDTRKQRKREGEFVSGIREQRKSEGELNRLRQRPRGERRREACAACGWGGR